MKESSWAARTVRGLPGQDLSGDGERLYSRWDFREVMTSGIAVAQPDLSHAGGISEVRRIAAMAETYDVAMAPHCPLGPIALGPACRSPSPYRTSSSRNRAWASTTTSGATCWSM
ncbi:hypothetical protein SGFS_024080 [Streptomyces graminofaciens]|uniref:Enolase C-terminal domain-containing protein n=1 Tax=Streptomyces graminofaciens TaxID=68212 RepID=A0ABN5VCS5_9ACTN|nr:hypothetical protein SGFS_024080 [Streptomyces graminofaciens]